MKPGPKCRSVIEDPETGEKLYKCSRCKEFKTESSFYASSRTGKRAPGYYCRSCKKAIWREYRKTSGIHLKELNSRSE